MLCKIKYTLLLIVISICPTVGQIEPMPPFEIYKPDYQTYRFEKDLYSFNIIDYMFEDSNRKFWLSTVHDLKRTNGYQFFNISQIMAGQNPFKGHIVDGQLWNDSTHYLFERFEGTQYRGHALMPSPPINIIALDSTAKSLDKLLFYDILRNENAYEIWTDSLHNTSLRIIAPDGRLLNRIEIPSQEGIITGFCMTSEHIWLIINKRIIVPYKISKEDQLIPLPLIRSPRNINIFHSDQHDNIWVSRQDSVLQIRKFTERYKLIPVLPLKNMSRIFEDNNGNMILGSVTFPNNIGSAYLYLREGGRWISLEPLINQNRDYHLFAGQNFQKEIFLAAKNNFSSLRFSQNPICEVVIDRKNRGNKWNFISRGIRVEGTKLYVLATNKGLIVKDLLSSKEKLLDFTDPDTGLPINFDCLRTIEMDKGGCLWFSACENLEGSENNHLIRYDTLSKKSKIFKINHPISAIQMGNDSILWIEIGRAHV